MPELTLDLSCHHAALMQWAGYLLPAWLRGKLDPEDLVSQTLLEALKTPEKFDERAEHEVLAYLRRALSNDLTDAMRKHGRTRTDVSPGDLAQSSVRLADWLAADHTSPSERAGSNERFARLAVALSELPDAQRVAVELRYLQSMKVADIARLMNRSEGAVSQLLHRAVTALRDVLTEPEA